MKLSLNTEGFLLFKKTFVYLFIVLLLSACSGGGRDVSKVETSIYGHWVDKSDNPEYKDVHYYINKEKFIMVDQGTKTISNYEISSSNDLENWIEITTEGRDNVGSLTRRLEFNNKDKSKLTHIIGGDSIKVSNERADSDDNQDMAELISSVLEDGMKANWEYVDDLSEPN
jgi:hypothetical protein